MKKRRLHLYTAAMLFACTYSLHGQTTYTDGVFMLNEDWYGHNNSTLNFIRPDHPTDPFEYYIIQNNESNAGQSLGATAQFGAIYGDYLFIISKQDQDAGDGLSPGESAETRQGGRIVVADAQTMEIKSRIPIIRANEKGVSIADGRSFVGVEAHRTASTSSVSPRSRLRDASRGRRTRSSQETRTTPTAWDRSTRTKSA